MLVDVVLGGADVLADEAELGDLAHGDGGGGRKGISPRQDGNERIGSEVDEVDRRVEDGPRDEGDVDIPRVEALDERRVLVLLDGAHDEARDLAPHASDDVGEQLDGDALERADDEPAARARGDVGDLLARGIEAIEDHLGVREQGAADGREDHRLRSSGPLEDRAAHQGLEARDLLADGGLGVAEDVRGPTEGALLRHGSERLEMAHLIARGAEDHSISIADRHDENSSLYVM